MNQSSFVDTGKKISKAVIPIAILLFTQLKHLWTQVLKHLSVHIYLVTAVYQILQSIRVLICRRFQSGRP